MKHLVSFRIYESKTPSVLTKKQEDFLNDYTQGTWSVNPTTGLVDIQGSFSMSGGKNNKFKSFLGIKFGNVIGQFFCSENELQSLEGAPQKVDGVFDCSVNQIQSLVGAPREVGGGFDCSRNKLRSLKGAPLKVGQYFNCSFNDLISLEGAPQKVNGVFDCCHNQLQSLAGAPEEVNGYYGEFQCWGNLSYLESLEGAPKKINKKFHCDQFQLGDWKSGKWNLEGWVEVLENGSKEAKKLILTLPYLQPDWLNMELQQDPGKTVHLLASCWKDLPEDMKSKIKIPSGYEDEFTLFSGFDELGLF